MNSTKYKPTYILIAINIAVYIYTAYLSGNAFSTDIEIQAMYGQWNLLVFNGYYWQLFSSMFIHASVFHLAGNMLFLLIFGLRAEEMFSLPEYLLVYLGGGLVGNLLSLVLGPDLISVGASGAIFAIFGAVVIYNRRSFRQSILGAIVYAFFLFFINIGPSVNILAHLGGLGFGLIVGYWLASRRKPEETYSTQFSYSTPTAPF
jgi:rhomboid protease GluP